MLESMYWKKNNYWQKKGLLGQKKNPFWGVETQITAHFAVNSYSLSKHLSFDMLESIGEKKQFMVIKGLFGQKGAFFGVRKAKNLKFFGKFLFSVKIPFI